MNIYFTLCSTCYFPPLESCAYEQYHLFRVLSVVILYNLLSLVFCYSWSMMLHSRFLVFPWHNAVMLTQGCEKRLIEGSNAMPLNRRSKYIRLLLSALGGTLLFAYVMWSLFIIIYFACIAAALLLFFFPILFMGNHIKMCLMFFYFFCFSVIDELKIQVCLNLFMTFSFHCCITKLLLLGRLH